MQRSGLWGTGYSLRGAPGKLLQHPVPGQFQEAEQKQNRKGLLPTWFSLVGKHARKRKRQRETEREWMTVRQNETYPGWRRCHL